MENKLVGLSNREVLVAGADLLADVKREIRKVVYGEEMEAVIDGVLFSLVGGWHTYLLANVGLGKTLLCLAAAKALDAKFNKIDGQPDLLPKDVVGFLWFNQATREFEVVFGPLTDKANLVLFNEINRATPRTQSAVLAAMEERHVPIHTSEYPLPELFVLLATANPQEFEGTYPLPEAQLDRFTMRLEIPFPSTATVLQILGDKDFHRQAYSRVLDRVRPAASIEDILVLRGAVFNSITAEERIDRYIDRLVRAVYGHELVDYVSPRRAIDLKRVAYLCAFVSGRDYVIPEDVQRYFVEVVAHATFLHTWAVTDPKRKMGPRTIAAEVVKNVNPDHD